MRQSQTNWFRLVKPEDTSSTESDGTLNSGSKRNGEKYFALTKFFLWYGIGVFLGLSIARFH